MKTSSRTKRICNLVRRPLVSTSSSTCNYGKNMEKYFDSKQDSYAPNSGKESPLPPDADLNTINALWDIISDQDESELPQSSTKGDGTGNISTPQNKDLSYNLFLENQLIEDKENTTPHPSPFCGINHLDIDCDNHFCPWFVENPFTQPSSQQSPCWFSVNASTPLSSAISTPKSNSQLSTTSTNVTPKSRKCTSRKDKGNIRRRHVHQWIDTKRKHNKNLGKEYLSRDGTARPAKQLKSACPITCRKQCFQNISETDRHYNFNKFWSLGDKNKQWEFITNLAIRKKKCRVLTGTESKRNFTIIYHLTKYENGIKEKIVVCKTMFLATFNISHQFVTTALNKIDSETGLLSPDQRGKHKHSNTVITEAMKKSVCDHIKAMKPVESHYVRQRSDKIYLDGDLNFTRLYELYKEWFDPTKYTSKAQTKRQYRDIVNENFKLSFYVPKKDQCDQCHIYRSLPNPTAEETNNHEKHVSNKTIARQLKSSDKKVAKISEENMKKNKTSSEENEKKSPAIITATFDFQKVLTAPHGNLSVFYYNRKLSLFNFTVFELGEKVGTCFMWDESEGKRGANEVSSCLLSFIANRSHTGTKEFRFWSDNCVGQNRNRIVYSLYMYASNTYKVNIKHTFLEKGHTQAEGDSVHALIERSAKDKLIFTPTEWYCLVRWAKQDGKPYIVEEMDHTKMFDFKAFLSGRNWSKNIQGETVNWNKIREVSVTANDPFKLNYKYDYCATYSTLVVQSNTRSTKHQNPFVPEALYSQRLPIPKAKKKDLLSMCKTKIIPERYHALFKDFTATDLPVNAEPVSED